MKIILFTNGNWLWWRSMISPTDSQSCQRTSTTSCPCFLVLPTPSALLSFARERIRRSRKQHVTFLNSVLYTLVDVVTVAWIILRAWRSRGRPDDQGFGSDRRFVADGIAWVLDFALRSNVKQLKLDGVAHYLEGWGI